MLKMKLFLTVVVVFVSLYYVNGYTIFPLPGQSAAVNPKFGRVDARPLSSAQSVTATNIVPFSSTLPPLSSKSYQTSRVPVPTTPASLKPLVVSSYQTSKAPEVRIAPKLSTLSSYYTSTLKAQKPSSLVQNVQSPAKTIVAASSLATDLLPPHESSIPATKPEPLKPIKPEIEAPAKDLLPPKLS